MEEEENSEKRKWDKVGQEQIHGLLFVEKLSWQQIIQDLIQTEQLDPWDIDLGVLANKFIDKVRQLEEANFFVSSQVLLAASLLLRLKSEILLDEYIPSLDAILFGRKDEQKKYIQERIELDEEIPGLTLRTPLPRFRKVTLEELMSALGQAIKTENRRIRKVIVAKQQELETALAIPRQRINVKDRIQKIYSKLKAMSKNSDEKIAFSELAGKTNHERVATFIPLLHLDSQHKVWLEQDAHLKEIWILLKSIYEKQNAESLELMKKEAGAAIEQLVEEEKTMMEEMKLKKEMNKDKKGKKKRGKEKYSDESDDFVVKEEDFEGTEEETGDSLTGFGKLSKEVEQLENVDSDED